MSFGLARGKQLDTSGVGFTREDLPPIPGPGAPAHAQWIDPRAWFEHPERPFELEVGSGKGTFLVQQAQLQPETNFLGIEYAGEFFRYAADRIRRNAIPNVKLLYHDATEFIRRVPDEVVTVLHLYFPDPWPKAKHHKRRSLNDAFLEQAHRILVPRGELRIVTDHPDYWAWMEEHFARWTVGEDARFERLPFTSPDSASEGEVVGTNFERKYVREGREFNSAVLKKR
ncbi:MAG: tRNA (guanosine(46)-N7)-methyltransferase TrmB [Phycisphaerales bacterium]|nr:tRNA (guanosine(46)-N7)-methyltransferase TrmB [Phycisphaerales bacterium]